MENNGDEDILSLAMKAKAKNYDNPERLVARIETLIARNVDYLKYRASKGRRGGYNELVAEDNEILAMAIVLLESMQGATPDE